MAEKGQKKELTQSLAEVLQYCKEHRIPFFCAYQIEGAWTYRTVTPEEVELETDAEHYNEFLRIVLGFDKKNYQ